MTRAGRGQTTLDDDGDDAADGADATDGDTPHPPLSQGDGSDAAGDDAEGLDEEQRLTMIQETIGRIGAGTTGIGHDALVANLQYDAEATIDQDLQSLKDQGLITEPNKERYRLTD